MTLEAAISAVKAAEKHYSEVYYGPRVQAVIDASAALDVANADFTDRLTREDWVANADSYLSLANESLQYYGRSRKGLQGYRRHMKSHQECLAMAASFENVS